MKVVVVGATGHIGSYLVPRLVAAGHEVVAISRGNRSPYFEHPAWRHVAQVQANRDAEDETGVFGKRLADAQPDAVVDLLCFTVASARQVVGRVGPDSWLPAPLRHGLGARDRHDGAGHRRGCAPPVR